MPGFLDDIKQAYLGQRDLENLLLDEHLGSRVMEAQPRWRKMVSEAQGMGLPVIAMSGSLAYFDSYRLAVLPQNLTQAQRDFLVPIATSGWTAPSRNGFIPTGSASPVPRNNRYEGEPSQG